MTLHLPLTHDCNLSKASDRREGSARHFGLESGMASVKDDVVSSIDKDLSVPQLIRSEP